MAFGVLSGGVACGYSLHRCDTVNGVSVLFLETGNIRFFCNLGSGSFPATHVLSHLERICT